MSDNTTFGRRGSATGSFAPARNLAPRAAPPPRQDRPQPIADGPAVINPELKAEWAAKASRPAPVLTVGVIAALSIIFIAEYAFSVGPIHGAAPGRNSLIALGALSRNLAIGKAEPWRLVTAVLLHMNPVHIIGNCVVLFFAGAALERLVGRAWLAAIFVISGLAGSLASLLCDPASTISVGASGAIMGVLAATLVCCFHAHAAKMRNVILINAVRVAIPALIPFSRIQGGPQIGYNAHGGGFIAGLVVGLVMLQLWPETEVFPRGRRVAAGIGWTGLAAAVLSFGFIALNYPAYAQAGEPFAPTLPTLNARTLHTPALGDQTLTAVQTYPHDPRTHLLRSLYLVNTHDLYSAEAEARAGLMEREALTEAFPTVEPTLHLLLAAILLEQGRRAEADTEAGPWCGKSYSERGTEAMRRQLITNGPCGGPAAHP